MCNDINFDKFPRPVVVFDTETTGTSRQDRLVEFAAIRFERGCAPVVYSTLINPEIPIPYAAQRVHKITDRMVATAPTYRQVHPRIAALFSGADVFAHNLSFDRQFLQQECDRIGRELSFSGYCTLKIARKIYPNRSGRGAHTLDAMANLCGVRNPNAHRALADVETLARVIASWASSHAAVFKAVLGTSNELKKRGESGLSIIRYMVEVFPVELEQVLRLSPFGPDEISLVSLGGIDPGGYNTPPEFDLNSEPDFWQCQQAFERSTNPVWFCFCLIFNQWLEHVSKPVGVCGVFNSAYCGMTRGSVLTAATVHSKNQTDDTEALQTMCAHLRDTPVMKEWLLDSGPFPMTVANRLYLDIDDHPGALIDEERANLLLAKDWVRIIDRTLGTSGDASCRVPDE